MEAYKGYELFTKRVYELLADSSSLNASKVQHNVKIEGRSGQKHQIDVFWEYEKDGKTHRVAIECKDYSRRISLDKVCAFKGVLDDLDGVNGIMVTKVGYQGGAKKYALKYGISLKELRVPGIGETIIGQIDNHFHIEIRHTLFWIDEEWASKNNYDIEGYRRRLKLISPTQPELLDVPPYIPLELKDNGIRDASGNLITTMARLEQLIPDHPTDDFPYVFKFEEAFIDSTYNGPVKIRAIMFDYNIEDQCKTIALDAGNLVKAILKDAQSNETDFVALQ